MRLAIVSTMAGAPWGGSEYLWADMAKQSLMEGHEVFMSLYDWSFTHPIVDELINMGAILSLRTRDLKTESIIQKTCRKILNKFKSSGQFQTLFEWQPDVICISQGSSFDVLPYGLFTCIQEKCIPYVLICQFNIDNLILDEVTRENSRSFFKKATKIGFVSEHNLRLAERQLAQSLPNAVVIQNPVNLNCKTYIDFPKEDICYFANVARLDVAFKGQDILLEAFSKEVWKQRDWICRFYGDGPDQQYLQRLAQHYEIHDRVQFLGHVNDIRSIWSSNHILVLPSRGEGTPLSLIEAMICGRPSIATDVGGNAEWLEEKIVGFIAEAPTAKSLGVTLERAWLLRNQWKDMGVRAHDYAIAKVDPLPGKSLLQLVIKSAILS